MFGEFHQALHFAIAFGPRHTEVAVHFFLGIEAFVLRHDDDAATAQLGESADDRVVVAEPCVPFTRFSLRLGPADPTGGPVTEGLQFLREGRRGFYASYAGASVLLHRGDRVFGMQRDCSAARH